MRPADQHIARDAFEYDVGRKLQTETILVDLSRDSIAELRIEGLEMSADFLARLLETDGSVGLGDLVLAAGQDQYVFVNFGHSSPIKKGRTLAWPPLS